MADMEINDTAFSAKIFKGVIVVDYQLQEISTRSSRLPPISNKPLLLPFARFMSPTILWDSPRGAIPPKVSTKTNHPRLVLCLRRTKTTNGCTLQRMTVSQMGEETLLDNIIQNAHLPLQEAGFPDDEIVIVKNYDNDKQGNAIQ
ncbi:hypothetical protein SEMRO_1414_G270610.1 [Seminavis robusta]|uniref:Uncharacterized protein n=1 Tax=Seminavis robusta TaxID=568900 RepID=A0A9N8ELH4_9STRA|nr:hypothetical protein SEMRO_1414_G270610.1 [Seminavis robusta]|eukprot:Sro1414_g270610.1 n/a (145) ;mRNA; f:246-680